MIARLPIVLASTLLLIACREHRVRLTEPAFRAIALRCGLDRPVFVDRQPLPVVQYVDHDVRRTMRGQATPKSICLARALDSYQFAMMVMVFDPPPLPLPPSVGSLAPMNATRH